MDPLPIIALAFTATALGFTWHNQPARAESNSIGNKSVSSGAGEVDWAKVVLWSFAFLSFAALFLAGCMIWIKCHSDYPR